MGVLVRGRYDVADNVLAMQLELFVELNDGHRVTARNVSRGTGVLQAIASRAGVPSEPPDPPTVDEAATYARSAVEDESLFERWRDLLLPVLQARARPRIRRVSRRPLAIELSPELRQALA
jgi:hypothetical protein